ncbi:MAG: sodium/solute symporter [Planctomycetota bacterium]|nr:sodium/solute symporter [Planctomycetota bacterium]
MILAIFLTCALQGDALEWSNLASLPNELGLGGHFVGVVGESGTLFTGGGANFPEGGPSEGGLKRWHRDTYLFERGNWTAGPDLPAPRGYGATVPWNGGLLFIGGCDESGATSEVLFLERKDAGWAFSRMTSMPRPTSFLAATLSKNRLWVLPGGTDRDGQIGLDSSFWSLDLLQENSKWKQHPIFPGLPRCKASIVSQVLGDGQEALFVFGGENPKHGILADAWRFLPASETWRKTTDLPRPLAAAAAINVGPTHTLLLPGDDGTLRQKKEHPGWFSDVYAYHTLTETWVTCSQMPLPVVTTSAVAWEDGFVVVSGETKPGVRTNQVSYFEISPRAPGLAPWDWGVIALYLGILVAKGAWFRKRNKGSEDYFVAGKRIPWWAAGLSIYGTTLSSITFLATPALAYATDLKFGPTWLAILLVVPLVVHVFLPFYHGLNLRTAYEYLEYRYSRSVRQVGSGAFILLQLARMGIVVYLPSLALSTVTGLDMRYCILVTGVLATGYTVIGGMEAVIWTDVTQVFVLFGGVFVALGIALSGSGGMAAFSDSIASTKLLVWDNGFSWTDAASWSLLLGATIMMVPTYTSDQTVVQRFLSVKDQRAAEKSAWLSGWLALPAGLIFPFLGVCLWAFYRENPQNLQIGMSDDGILPLFIGDYLPTGLAGLVIAGLFAATMSSLDSSMHSVATAFTNDFYRPRNPEADDDRILKIAKRWTLGAGLFGTAAAIFLASFDIRSLFLLFLKALGLLSSGVATLFLLGAFVPRVHATAALLGAGLGTAVLAWAAWNSDLHAYWYGALGMGVGIFSGWMISFFIKGPRASPEVTAYKK